ncbi:MAG: hypothetical protein WC229_03005 [Candidatus Paceibacterota bacterium]|jgi:hypothetical protein
MQKKNLKRGILLVEVIISVFIISVVVSVLITASNLYLTASSSGLKSTKAMYFAQEGMEAVRIIRDKSWQDFQSLNEGEDYYLYFSISASSTWNATTSVFYKTTGGIDRWFVISPVRRAYTRITEGEGEVDLYTKKVDVFVSWQDRERVITKTLSTYLTKIIPD